MQHSPNCENILTQKLLKPPRKHTFEFLAVFNVRWCVVNIREIVNSWKERLRKQEKSGVSKVAPESSGRGNSKSKSKPTAPKPIACMVSLRVIFVSVLHCQANQFVLRSAFPVDLQFLLNICVTNREIAGLSGSTGSLSSSTSSLSGSGSSVRLIISARGIPFPFRFCLDFID